MASDSEKAQANQPLSENNPGNSPPKPKGGRVRKRQYSILDCADEPPRSGHGRQLSATLRRAKNLNQTNHLPKTTPETPVETQWGPDRVRRS